MFRIDTGKPLPIAATSNENWPDHALRAAQMQAKGSAAIVIGQAHATSVLPQLAAQLDTITFADIVPGHDEIFEARLRALEAMDPERGDRYDFAALTAEELIRRGYAVSGEEQYWLECESQGSFDLSRLHDPQSVIVNAARRAELLERYSTANLDIVPCQGDVQEKSFAKRAGGRGPLSWVHLSNVGEMSRDTELAGKLIDFMNGLDGLSDDTLVTYSVHDDFREGYYWPIVRAVRPEDVTVQKLTEFTSRLPKYQLD